MEKEYGKLTEAQFKRLIRKLPELRSSSNELDREFKSATKEKLQELLGDGVCWAPLYEFSFVQVLARLIMACGLVDWLKDAVKQADPQEILISEMDSNGDLEWDGGYEGLFTKADLIGVVTAMQRNILSIMIYKRTLCSLIAEARDEDTDAPLFDAIRVDRTVVTCPTFAERMARAELRGDKKFFMHLNRALKGLSHKHWEGYRDLRYSLAVLRELGFKNMSDAQLEHLLVDVLKVYPKSFTARKNLRKQFYESNKIKTL